MMERRSFLKKLAALGVALAVPAAAVPEVVTLEVAKKVAPSLSVSDLDELFKEIYWQPIREMLASSSVLLAHINDELPPGGKIKVHLGRNS